jgi:hypothetical protein
VAEYPRVATGLAPVLLDTLADWLDRVEDRLPTYTAQR